MQLLQEQVERKIELFSYS